MSETQTVEERIAAKVAGIPTEAETPVEEATPVEETTATETTPVETADEERLFAGRYKTVEELERAVEEQKQLIGRQSAEVADARALAAQIEELRSEVQQSNQPALDPSGLEEFLAENPHQIPVVAQQAMDRGDTVGYQTAMKSWQQVDSLGAADFHTRALLAAERDAIRQEFAPAVTGVQKQQTAADFAAAYESVSSQHEDFSQVLNSISEDTLRGFPPEALAALQNGDKQSKERVLELLYRYTKADQVGTISEAAANATAEAQLAARADKTNATVATQTGTLSREPEPPPTWRDAFVGSDAFRRATGELKHR